MAAKVITNFIAKALFKKKGAIANRKAVDFSADALEQRLRKVGIDPNTIQNENQLNEILAAVKQAEDQAFNQKFGDMLGGSKFDRKGEVFDLTGKKINQSKGIMAGKEVNEQTLKEGLMKTDNPFSDLVKTTEKGPKTLAERKAEVLARMNREIKQGLSDKEFRSEKTSFRLNIGKNNPEFNQDLAKKIINREIYTDLSDSQRKEFLDDLDFVLKNPRDGNAQGGRAGYFLGGLLKLASKTSPLQAYKKYLQSVKTRAQKGDMKSLVPELGAVSGAGIFVNRRMQDVLENMKEKDMENNLENFRKELNADPFYKDYPELKDKVLENYTEKMFGEKRADGGRAGFADGTPNKKITIDASGSKSGKQQIEGAPEGITMDNESINAIIKADIPISQKIDLLAKYQYGKGRTRIEKDDSEIFMDEGGFKSRDIGLGFNKDGEGIGGTLMYNMETGDPEFNVRFKKTFADGGRIGYKDGPDQPGRRKFMKIMGGLATLPIIGKYLKPAIPLIKKGAEITGPALDKIIETVMSTGKLISQSGKRLKELTTKKKLKDVEVEEDMMNQSYTIKTKDKTIYYKPGRQDEMGIDDDIIEVVEDKITKKAGGGIARMLGE